MIQKRGDFINLNNFLINLPLFKNLSKSTIERIIISDKIKIESYDKNKIIIEKNQKNNNLIVVLRGELVVKKGQVVINRLVKGNIFGVSTLFLNNKNFSTTVITSKPSQLMFLPSALIFEIMKLDFNFTQSYIEFLSNRIQYLNSVIDRYTGSNSAKKLANFLLNERKVKGDILKINMTDSAKALNLSRASMYRALDELISKNLISKDGKLIKILDVKHLEEFSFLKE